MALSLLQCVCVWKGRAVRLCEFVAMSGQHRAQLHEMKKPQIERKYCRAISEK